MTNENQVVFSPKLKPLFNPKTRYVILVGGRGGGKSFALASAMALSTYDDEYNILYTRYTMKSADVSIIPEFMDKLKVLNSYDDFRARRTDVVNRGTGSMIFFRGIKAQSKDQTANLKSLHKVKIWVMDEAQDLRNEREFDTIDDSLREKDADIHIILAMNPDSVQHWIYKRFFQKMDVPDDFNGVKGNVTYININWEDNRKNLHPTFIDKAEMMREEDMDKYNHIYGSQWTANKEGIIYKNWEEITDDEYPMSYEQWWGQDWGYADFPNASVRMCYDPITATIYVKEIMKDGKLVGDAAKAIIKDAELFGMKPCDCEVYCDPSGTTNIQEYRSIYDLSAVKGYEAKNRIKAYRIHFLQGFKVRYIGHHIRKEVENYLWKTDPNDETLFIDEPNDGNDHFLDAINYASMRLKMMGVNGDV